MKVVGDGGNGYDWVGHGMSAIGKKGVASDEWLVARSTCEYSRVPKQTLEPRASASAIRGMAANYFLWFVVLLCALVAPVLSVAEIKQVAVFDQDVQAFAISQDNHVVYAVERMKRIKKLIVE